MKDLFIKFLKKNNAFENFNNMASLRIGRKFDGDYVSVDDYLEDEYVKSSDFLCCLHTWENTEQGWEYWNKLEKKWHELLISTIIK